MKYHIITFGCQMNISDSERIASVLENINYKKSSNINEANLVLVNMCSVRQTAVDRVYGLAPKFKKLKAENKKITTILTGCVLQKDKNKMLEIFDYVVNIKDITKLPEILKTKQETKQKTRSAQKIRDRVLFAPDNYLNVTPKYSNKFSANVPIMTGCNNFCSYCVVPYAREREVSRPAEEIICEVKNLIINGCKEIWLLGQNVNSYKHTRRPSDRLDDEYVINFPKLLGAVNNIPGNFWIRFTSSHPKDFSDELINAMASCKKVTPYLNLPAQSGDNGVLKAMNRHYTVAQYKTVIKKVRMAIPNISLSTDIIVGFPGETKKQFENTVKLFKDIKFDMAYINKYSPRPGTAATKLKDNISPAEKKHREKVLTKILKQTALSHNKKMIGKKTMVLVESKNKNYWFGKNEQYKTVKINTPRPTPKTQNLIRQFVRVKITGSTPWGLAGELIK